MTPKSALVKDYMSGKLVTFHPETDVLDAVERMLARQQDLAAILLECTNVSPYRHSIAAATGLPVFDLMTAISMLADAKATTAASA